MINNYFMDTKTDILENKNLRNPQIEAYAEVYEHFMSLKKKTHAIVVLPTGSGKTGLISILPFNICKGRTLIIAPQLTILDTIESSLDSMNSNNFWTDKEIIKNPNNLPVVVKFEGKDTRRDHMEKANIVIANIQKLQSRNEQSMLNNYSPDFFDMIIIDEAHHAEAKTWIENLEYFSEAKIVKITATAYRTDKKQLVGELVYKYKLSQAMSKKYVKSLENFNYIPETLYFNIDNDHSKKYTHEQILELNLKDEDWISRSVAFSDECKNSVVRESLKILEEKRKNSKVPHKIIAAASNIEEANTIALLYNKAGYRSVAIHNKLTKQEKERIFSDIENHRVDVVVNVSMMGEGYDHKYLSVAAIFRAFKNLLPYEQFIGRILRVIPECEVSSPKDNIGSVVAHKLLFLDDLWEYYKNQMQESDIILEMQDIDVPDYDPEQNGGKSKIIEVDFGKVSEEGSGTLEKSIYMETEYLQKAREEQLIRDEKIRELANILNISHDAASDILDNQSGNNNEFKRPDVLLKIRRRTTNSHITEVIVPELISLANVDIKGDEFKDLPIFQGKYAWIKNNRNNGAMLAIYFNSYLKNSIGRDRVEWSNEDYEKASNLLEQQYRYLEKFFTEENDYD